MIFIFFFLNNYYILNFIKKIFFNNIEMILIFIIIFFTTLIYINIIIYINNNINLLISKLNINLYFFNYYDVVRSVLVLCFFFLYYVYYIRIMIFFSKRDLNINIFDLEKNFLIKVKSFPLDFIFSIIILLFIICICYILIFFFYKIIFFFSKKHFLKLHYYYFYRINFYCLIIKKIEEIEIKILDFFGDLYIYFVFIKFHGFKLFMILFLIFELLNNNGFINNFLLILPYYSLYYFILNIYNFVLYSLNEDFEILIMESYYKKINFLMELDESKKNTYTNFLLSNYSEYKFKDCGYLKFKEKIEPNFLMIETYKYTINNYPNDFFSRIKNVKPQFIKNDLK